MGGPHGTASRAPVTWTAAYDNTVTGNTLLNNGEAGVGIHAHAPDQNVSGNVITNNWISGNGIDPDFVNTSTHIGIMVGSAVDAQTETVAANRIANEDVGIYRSGPVTLHGLKSNKFASSVTTPVH